MPTGQFRQAVERFYQRDLIGKGTSWKESDTDLFWRLLDAAPGSSRESRLRDELVTRFRYIATRVARRFAIYGDFDEFEQEGMIALDKALPRYIPSFGPFKVYATVCCRVCMVAKLSQKFNEGVPEELQQPRRLVRRAILDHAQRTGAESTEGELSSLLEIPIGTVREVLALLRYRQTSLDAPIGDSTRTRHDTVGRTQADFEDAELETELVRWLSPTEKFMVCEHLIEQRPLPEVAERAGISLQVADELLVAAREKLAEKLVGSPM